MGKLFNKDRNKNYQALNCKLREPLDDLRSKGVTRWGHLNRGSIQWIDHWPMTDLYRSLHSRSSEREPAK